MMHLITVSDLIKFIGLFSLVITEICYDVSCGNNHNECNIVLTGGICGGNGLLITDNAFPEVSNDVLWGFSGIWQL